VVRERKAGILGTAGQRRRDVGEVGYRGSVLIREASAVRRTPLAGHSRLDDYNRVGYNQSINQTDAKS
jgi:hypothetical protein